MPDVFTGSARHILDAAAGDMRAAIEGVSPEALNRRPGGDDTNSLAVLAVHAMSSTREWLSVAVGAPLPERDRDSEFLATMPDATSLLTFIESMRAECGRLLAGAGDIDWSANSPTWRPDADDPAEVQAAWALLHAISHLREHTGQMGLTRQLLDGP